MSDKETDTALILDAVRTPIGRYGGSLSLVRPDDMGAHVIRSAMDRLACKPDEVDDVYLGCINQAGEDSRNFARMSGLLAGLPVETPGVTVNRLCASGLETVVQAGRACRVGDADLILAGGVESMSRAPLVMAKSDRAFPYGNQTVYDTTLGWRFVNPKFAEMYSTEPMGETAENVAERYGISREDQDALANESNLRAVAAQDEGLFDDEMSPIEVTRPKGQSETVSTDEGPRRDSSVEKLSKLKSSFKEGGSVTAGNSSQISDGATCIVVGSQKKAESLGCSPLARIVSVGTAGVDPSIMGIGPVPATRIALERAGLTIDDIDLIELNEAFASQAVASMRELDVPHEKMNVNGGAIALGHPVGCTGARILATLLWEMRRRDVRYGLATMCVGVGQGQAMIVERV